MAQALVDVDARRPANGRRKQPDRGFVARPGEEAVLRELLVESCLQGIRLEDTSDAMELLEAHIFQEVRFDSCVRELRLEQTADQTVIANAQKFCKKWGIHLERL